MELHTFGAPESPAVLLIPAAGMGADDLRTVTSALEKSFRLLLSVREPGETEETFLSALEEALIQDCAGYVRGGYGLREGAGLLLSLVQRGRIHVDNTFLEGAFSLPAGPLPERRGRIWCWTAKRDKAAKKARKALEKTAGKVSTLTMKKLRAGQAMADLRPDLMAKQLRKALGDGVTVRVTAVLPQRAEQVWRQVGRLPAGKAELSLGALEPLRRDGAQRVQELRGAGERVAAWNHVTRLEDLGPDGTICTDQMEISAGKLNGLAKPLAKLYLRGLQRRRARALKKG